MKVLVIILSWLAIPRLLPQAAEIVILHDGSYGQFEPAMEWPQRLNMVFRQLKHRIPTFRLTETTSLLSLGRFRASDKRKLIGLITLARCTRSNTLQAVAKRMFPHVPVLPIDTEYCHEPERLVLTWLKVDWPCFFYALEKWVEQIHNEELSILSFPLQTQISSTSETSLCPMRSRIATHIVDAYQERYRRNILNGRTLRLGVLNNSLSWIYGNVEDPKTLKFTGVLSEHMESVAHALNYTFVLVVPEDHKVGTKTSNGSWNGLLGLITNKQIDLMGYATSFLQERYEIIDWIFAGYDNTFAFTIPPPDVERNWLASSQPYHYKVWMCIIGSLILLAIFAEFTDYARARQTRSARKFWLHYVFNYLRVLLNQGGDATINHAPSRLVMGAWCIFALIGINLYTSVLTGYLSIPRLKPLVKSLEELAQSSHIRMIYFNNSSLNPLFTNPNATGDIAIIAERSRHYPEDYVKDAEAAVEEVATKGTRVYVDALPNVYGSLALDYRKHGRCRASLVRFNFFTIPASYGVPKGSPYWHFLYNARARVVEVGIFKQISKKLLEHSPCVDMMGNAPSSSRLTLVDLWSPYILSFIGIGFAVFSFLIEILSKKMLGNFPNM